MVDVAGVQFVYAPQFEAYGLYLSLFVVVLHVISMGSMDIVYISSDI